MLELLRHTLRSLRARPMRSLLALLGIGAGVALYVAIRIINQSTLAYFSEAVQAMSGKAQLSVTGAESGFPAEVLAVIRATPGVEHAVPLVELPAYVRSADPEGAQTLMVMGVEWEQEPLVRHYGLSGGAGASSPLAALAEPGGLLLARGYAERLRLRPGDRLQLITQEGARAFVVRALLDPVGPAAAFGGKLAVTSLAQAQGAFGMEAKLTRVDVVVAGSGDVDPVAASLRKRLGPAFQVQRPEAAAQGLERMVEAYQLLLAFLSALALVIGALVLATTVSVTALERRRDIGILRAIGASRGAVFWLLQAHALVLGALGAVLGIVAGVAVAELLVSGISRSLSNQYMVPIDVAKLRYGWTRAGTDFVFATAFALASSMWVALRAGRIAPMEAIRPGEIALGRPGGGWLAASGAAGGLALAYLAVMTVTGRGSASSAWQVANALVGWLAALALAPWLVVALVRSVGALAGRQRLFPLPGVQLALHNLARRSRESGRNVLTIAIGLLLVVTVSAIHDSFKANLQRWLDRVLYADLVVSSAGRLLRLQVQPLQEDLAQAIGAVPGVDAADGYGAMGVRNVKADYRGREIVLKAFDRPHPAMKALPFDFRDAQPMLNGGDIFRPGTEAALVSDSFARNFGTRTGDRLVLHSPTGPVGFTVIGEVTDYATPDGVVYITRETYKRHWRDPLVTFFAVMVQPGASAREVQERIHRSLGLERGVYASLNEELRRQMHEILDESFAYTRAIEAAALLVGLIGLASAMASSVASRRREFGVLRAVGMPRAMLRRMVLSESVFQGVLAALAAAAFGLLLAYLSLVGLVSAATGWHMAFHPRADAVLGVGVIGLACGALAGLLPASKAAGEEISAALGYE